MKKVTLLIVMICSLSVYSRSAMNYLIQQGGGNGSTWTKTLGANDSIVDLTIANKDFTGWLTSRTSWLAGDQVWVAAGTYNIASVWTIPSIVVGSVYGGFAGTENSVGERSKGVNAWIYLNETVINGSASTAGILNAGGDRTMVIDGLTFTGCSSTAGQAV